MKISWEEYKEIIGAQIRQQHEFIYRGQSDSSWSLTTSLHRTGQVKNENDFLSFFKEVIPSVQEQIEAWDGTRRDLSDSEDMAQFIAFLQHNGFPTPLLDWSFSPYIAAYFAFEGVNHFSPQADEVAIYVFDQAAWAAKYKPTYLYDEPAGHVTLLRPNFRGNHKQMLQQGVFWFTNCESPEKHVRLNESDEQKFLVKYTLSVKERKLAMRDLELMGVTAMQLSPGVESVCKKAYESMCARLPVGKTPTERTIHNLVELPSFTKKKLDEEFIQCTECSSKIKPKNLKKHMRKQHES